MRDSTHVLLMAVAIAVLQVGQAQRLSQGASDWYMRFHSNFDFVKRNVDQPVTRSFVVSSEVKFRYAVTTVTMVVHNPANVEQPYNFGFVMPKRALVSNATIVRRLLNDDVTANDVQVVRSAVNISQWLQDEDFSKVSEAVSAPIRYSGIFVKDHFSFQCPYIE